MNLILDKILVVLFLTFTFISPNAYAVLIGSDVGSDQLYTIDPNGGALTSVGALGDPIVAGLAYDTSSGFLYGSSTSTNSLLLIDQETAETTVIGNFGVSLMHSIEYNQNNGMMYGYSQLTCTLYTIDTATAALTEIGIGGAGISGMAYDYINDIMYGVDAGPSGSTGLYTIDLLTGSSTFVGSFNNDFAEQMVGLAFDPTLGLIGTDNGLFVGTLNQLYSIDASTGNASLIGELNTGNFLGLTYIPTENAEVPAPSSILLLLLPLLYLLFFNNRGRPTATPAY